LTNKYIIIFVDYRLAMQLYLLLRILVYLSLYKNRLITITMAPAIFGEKNIVCNWN